MTVIINKWKWNLKKLIAQKPETLRKKSNMIYARYICWEPQTLMKDLNKKRNIPFHEFKKFNIVKISIFQISL